MDLKEIQMATGRSGMPNDWRQMSLGGLGTCLRGVSYDPKADLSDGDRKHTVRLLRSNNVQAGKVVLDDIQYVHERRVAEVQFLQTGDLVDPI